MTRSIDYTTPLPTETGCISHAEDTNDRLALAFYAACHAPGGHGFKQGKRAMYLRAFDRNGGKALAPTWHWNMGCPWGNAKCPNPEAVQGNGFHTDCIDEGIGESMSFFIDRLSA